MNHKQSSGYKVKGLKDIKRVNYIVKIYCLSLHLKKIISFYSGHK